ncbi:bifunctional glutamate N-acetyltransferase/amino-acid acetyltransferase ArgJ [Treponema sp.]
MPLSFPIENALLPACITQNLVKAASVLVTKKHLTKGSTRAIICNSGNANACTGENGLQVAFSMAELAAAKLGIAASDVLVGSTGVIGVPLPLSAVEKGLDSLIASLAADASGHDAALEAIMTTDTKRKEISIEIELGGKSVRLGAMAKGAGMIHPNMATMLSFITSDAAIERELLEHALRVAVKKSFNRVSVDGDTSTNDMVLVLANGAAGNKIIASMDQDYAEFETALSHICVELAKDIARDGEGATHLVACTVTGASSEEVAEKLAKSVISSSLVKAACFGADANWGRILCAMGYAGVPFDPEQVSVRFESRAGSIEVCRQGASLPFSEEDAKKILSESEISILIQIGEAVAPLHPHATKVKEPISVTAWGCDLTYEYVRINGDYRS